MKTFKLLVLLLLVCTPCFAGNNQIEILNSARTPARKTISVICVAGYKFILTDGDSSSSGSSMVQIFRKTISSITEIYPPQPVKCNE